ncbi:MAG TPA: hypothetical protein VJV87_00335 [Sphingomicrobium sp.]|nr:hypothetical protein [Sphingomicrobium sp.]
MTSIDDPDTTEPTREELLTLNAALRLRLDMTVSALLAAAYRLDEVRCEWLDETPAEAEILAGLLAAGDMARAAVQLARGETTDIPRSLLKDMPPQRQVAARRLLEATR